MAAFAAYGLFFAFWALSVGFSHTYAHWIEGVGTSNLPGLTVHVLAVLNIEGASALSTVISKSLWLILALWPASSLAHYLRSASPDARGTLALNLIAWLFLFLAGILVVGAGLWLPFSLL